ncbi:extracellular solute-binding protein [Paenibacillus hamazuiensis]|uniref:extracellular solute-binding protein n=1 Tax=Paenibacillus hamazuiensis TaxID=2936508 RepID=UPI00200F8FB8|nr:extracellular solute-binding protein [Paenibacillus hamazuiensis]
MKKRNAAAMVLLSTAMLAACSSGETATNAKPGDTKPAAASEKVDQFRMPGPVEVSIFKSVNPTAKLPDGDTVENNQYTRYIKDKTNISFKVLWYASGQDYDQKYKLALASNDLPDAIIVDEAVFRSLAEGGQIEDLTEVYKKYASPLMQELYATTNGKALEKATYKGKLMAIPNISVQGDAVSMLWVRKDWLDKLGLQPPKTMDDVTAIAKAFIEKDPDGNGKADTVGLTGSNSVGASAKAGHHSFKGIYGAFNAYPGNWLKDASGKIVYGSTLPETKMALAKLREMYAAGLIDKEFALRKDPHELVVGGKAGMFFGPWWSSSTPLRDTVKNDPTGDWKPYIIADAKGQLNSLMIPVSNKFLVVKKGFKHPEALMIYINTLVAAERNVDPDAAKLDLKVSRGDYYPLYSTYDYADAVTRKLDLLQKAMEGKMKREELNAELQLLYDRAMRDKANPKADLNDWSATYGYLNGGAALRQKINEVYSAFTSTTKTMERRWANLEKLESETFFKIIMGEQPLDAFDKFVKDWKEQGGDQIVKEIEEELAKNK